MPGGLAVAEYHDPFFNFKLGWFFNVDWQLRLVVHLQY